MATPRIDVPMECIKNYCQKWKVQELPLFGSVLTDDGIKIVEGTS